MKTVQKQNKYIIINCSLGSPLGCYIWKKVKPINKLVYFQEEINYLYPFLFPVSEIIWRESQNIWSIVVQLSNKKFGFISSELTKILFWKLNTNLTGEGVLLRFLVFCSCQEHGNKRKGLFKNVCLPENFCWVLQTILGFEPAKFCPSAFCPARPFWPVSCHADSNR